MARRFLGTLLILASLSVAACGDGEPSSTIPSALEDNSSAEDVSDSANQPADPRTSEGEAAENAPRNLAVEAALDEIPPEQVDAFFAALQCEMNASPRNMTADYIRDLAARLNADPSLASC